MIPRINAYIREHESKWPVQITRSGRLTPLVRFNKEANADVEREKIGRVILWFHGSSAGPVLVTKIMDSSVPLDLITTCVAKQQEVNRAAGAPIFPDVYDAALIFGKPVVFMEAVDALSYQLELAKAIFGPAANIQSLKLIVHRQFSEIGDLFALLAKIEVSLDNGKWGDWAFHIGQQFRDTYGLDKDCVSDGSLEIMAKHIDSLPLQRNFVLVDHYCANYFPGPRVVDQMDSSLKKRMEGEPGLLDLFRFIVAYFRTSPIQTLYPDWLGAIAASLHDEEGGSIFTGPPVRRCLQELGLDLNEVPQIWGLVMVAFFLRALDEFAFHLKSTEIDRVRMAFWIGARRLVQLQRSIERGDYRVEESFWQRPRTLQPQCIPAVHEYGRPPTVKLIQETGSYNILSVDDHYVAVAQSLGPVSLFSEMLGERELAPCLLIGDTLDEATAKVQQMEPKVELVGESPAYNFVKAGERFLAVSKELGPMDLFEEVVGRREMAPWVLVGDKLSEVRRRARIFQSHLFRLIARIFLRRR